MDLTKHLSGVGSVLSEGYFWGLSARGRSPRFLMQEGFSTGHILRADGGTRLV
jgi:hypothetical protein